MVWCWGLKQAAPQILATILTTLLEGIEEKAVERQIEKDPQRHLVKRPSEQAAPVQLLHV